MVRETRRHVFHVSHSGWNATGCRARQAMMWIQISKGMGDSERTTTVLLSVVVVGLVIVAVVIVEPDLELLVKQSVSIFGIGFSSCCLSRTRDEGIDAQVVVTKVLQGVGVMIAGSVVVVVVVLVQR